MIILHKIGNDKKDILVNAELIETIEEIPDTIIKLTTGKKIIVKEKKEEVIKLVVYY